jgi:hypothetical protein
MRKDQLLEDRQIFERLVRSCGIAHEDVKRDSDGKAIISGDTRASQSTINTMYISECSDAAKHFGCPHFFQLFVQPAANRILKLIDKESDADVDFLTRETLRLSRVLGTIDTDMRYARAFPSSTASQPYEFPVLFNLKTIPSLEQAKEKVDTVLRDYEKEKPRVEEYRLKFLEKIDMLLARTV